MKASNSRQDFTVPSLLRGKEATRIRLHTRQARGYQPKCLVLTRRYSAVAVKIPKIPRSAAQSQPAEEETVGGEGGQQRQYQPPRQILFLLQAGKGGGGRGCVDVSMGGSDV